MIIRSKIQALITAANTKTGESDTTLTDAIQTLVDGYGQGGGGIELLVDDTTTENVAIINVAIPSDKQKMKAYFVGLYGTTSAADWVYPHLNASASSVVGSCYFTKASSYNLVAVFGKAGAGTSGYAWPFSATGRPESLYTSGSSLTNILFNLYNSSSRFQTGFNVKVWGVPSP